VTPAELIGSQWIIEKGLKPGETIVAEGVQKVKSGVRVQATPLAPEGAAKPAAPPPAPAKGEKR